MARPITFLSDYGLADEFVGVVHAVIGRLCPDARVIDITHGIGRHDVAAGALALARALPYAAPGVHLAVVDPEVGARRRAVALECAQDGRVLVGPDNGLLAVAAQRFGGVVDAVEISESPWRLTPVSATFHGRDVFAPVTARLAAGRPLREAGNALAIDELVPMRRSAATIEDGTIVAHAVTSDGFGNILLDLEFEPGAPARAPAWLLHGRPVRLQTGGGLHETRFVRTFADVGPGEVLVYEDASRTLAVAINGGHAADDLGVRPGDEIRLSAAP